MLKRPEIKRLFVLLNGELKKDDIKGELYLVGGAVMCLAFGARPATRDLDGYFVPTTQIRKAAARVAIAEGLNEDWLNDGVKGFLSAKGAFEPYLKLSNLNIFCATAEYLLAMKCLAMRIGEEFQDIDDVRYLLRNLGVTEYKKAVEIIGQFYPLGQFPPKTLYVLEDLLSSRL